MRKFYILSDVNGDRYGVVHRGNNFYNQIKRALEGCHGEIDLPFEIVQVQENIGAGQTEITIKENGEKLEIYLEETSVIEDVLSEDELLDKIHLTIVEWTNEELDLNQTDDGEQRCNEAVSRIIDKRHDMEY